MATETKPTYLQLISQDEKAVQKESLKLKAQEAGLELNRQIFDLTVKISHQETEVAALQRQIPYSVASEFAAVEKLKQYKSRLKFAQTIKEERFADASI